MNESSFENLLFYIGEYAKKVGRLTTRPVLLTYFVMIDDATPINDKISLAASIAYVVLPIDLLSAKRFPVLGWLDEVVSLSVAYNKVQHHITREMERKADEILDKWFPEFTKYEINIYKFIKKIF